MSLCKQITQFMPLCSFPRIICEEYMCPGYTQCSGFHQVRNLNSKITQTKNKELQPNFVPKRNSDHPLKRFSRSPCLDSWPTQTFKTILTQCFDKATKSSVIHRLDSDFLDFIHCNNIHFENVSSGNTFEWTQHLLKTAVLAEIETQSKFSICWWGHIQSNISNVKKYILSEFVNKCMNLKNCTLCVAYEFPI